MSLLVGFNVTITSDNTMLAQDEPDAANISSNVIPDNSQLEKGDDNNAFETELSTIEEQPEFGYNSDSNDTDMLLPKTIQRG